MPRRISEKYIRCGDVVPFGVDRIELQKSMTDSEINTKAHYVARQIQSKVSKTADKCDPQTWIDAAYRLGCKARRLTDPKKDGNGLYVHNAPGGPILCYAHESGDHPYWVCRRIIHELAHHFLIVDRKASAYPNREERYDDTRETVQHQVAQRVELILMQDAI